MANGTATTQLEPPDVGNLRGADLHILQKTNASGSASSLKNTATASRLTTEAVEAGQIVHYDIAAAPKLTGSGDPGSGGHRLRGSGQIYTGGRVRSTHLTKTSNDRSEISSRRLVLYQQS